MEGAPSSDQTQSSQIRGLDLHSNSRRWLALWPLHKAESLVQQVRDELDDLTPWKRTLAHPGHSMQTTVRIINKRLSRFAWPEDNFSFEEVGYGWLAIGG